MFGVEVKSVTEGDSVTLQVRLTQIQENEEIEWKFEDILIADINRKDNNITYYINAADGRFRDRLKLDTQSGSLTIMNTTTKHTGHYKVTRDHWTSVNNKFSLTVSGVIRSGELTRTTIESNEEQFQKAGHQQSNDILLLSAAAAVVVGCLLIAAAIWVFCKKIRTSHQEVETHAEEITYAEPTFYRTKAQKSSVQVEPDVVYAGVTEVAWQQRHTYLESQEVADTEVVIFTTMVVLGVFGVKVKSVSVTEGDSVTLPVKLTQIQENEEIEWKFEDILIADINRKDNNITYYNNAADGRFRDRLKLDTQSGSLTIMNTTTKHTGHYKVTRDYWTSVNNTFSLTVYAHLAAPVINRDCSSSVQYCSVLCSVVNVSTVSLSWYKGNSLLSSISVSNLSISLSLPLEVEYQDKNTYSCVVYNPISNQTTDLNISTLCQPCPEHTHRFGVIEAVIRLVLSALVGVAAVAVLIYDIRSRHFHLRRRVQTLASNTD
nr:uncharacterized protein LOC100334996 [Danio rerio]|eukprot:XP_021325355.1 uncharacterized protein LOC100334996 [Danio rerio]